MSGALFTNCTNLEKIRNKPSQEKKHLGVRNGTKF